MNLNQHYQRIFPYAIACALAGWAIGILGSCLTGCSCRDTIPHVVQAQSLVDDAQAALDQAQLAVLTANLPPETAERARQAIRQAHDGLRVASTALAASVGACEAQHVPEIFQVFLDAWKVIRTIVPVMGTCQEPCVGIKDPIVYTLAQE